MNRRQYLLFAALASLLLGGAAQAATEPAKPLDAVLDSTETAQLVYQREEEKLARDIYQASFNFWAENAFYNTSQAEQRHMDALLKMLEMYGIADPVGDNGAGEFTDTTLAGLYSTLANQADDSLPDAFRVGAYIEELDIQDLRAALQATDEPSLTNAYTHLLAASRNHLRVFVSHLTALGETYEAQVLDPADLEQLTDGFDEVTRGENFTINNGISESWHYPATVGQGFFIAVYTDLQTMFLGWFTFDTERPADGVTAQLGDAGHRWLTAYGTYAGPEAELDVEITSGGIFDSAEPPTAQTAAGSMLLQFENCMSGSIIYDIPSIGRQGVVPIVRLAMDNAMDCQQQGR